MQLSLGMQLHGRRLELQHYTGGERPLQSWPAVVIHARLWQRKPDQHPEPSGRRRERPVRRSPGALCAAAGAAALLFLIDITRCKLKHVIR